MATTEAISEVSDTLENTQENTQPTQIEVAEIQNNLVSKKARNFSFKNKKVATMDAVGDGINTFVVPATPGCVWWAILKIMYENFDKPVTYRTLIDGVEELMKDRDENRWNRYIGKKSVTTVKNGQRVIKETKSWRQRVLNNAKTLTRLGGTNVYGLRIKELGHKFLHNCGDAEPYFIITAGTNN